MSKTEIEIEEDDIQNIEHLDIMSHERRERRRPKTVFPPKPGSKLFASERNED